MTSELALLSAVMGVLRAHWQQLRREPEAGYTTEAIIMVAILAALALAVGAIIVSKVTAKASSIPTD